ncbi:MAG: hypothetical protein L3K10_07175, partial [Thermoplasmata archaeon]|nr:hypothetical protein [Thermoplasmata archaeon]
MAEGNAGVPSGEPRVSTGNVGVDAMLNGGLIARRPYLIVGPAGTGKTTLALQFLCAGIRRGERALLVTLEEPPNEVRANHPALAPELARVDVFDAIPDVMRYERAPFKDIAAVRSATPFGQVPDSIRKTPELSSVEVTITALEQMLRTEVQRKAYTRIAIDSLTALQYFCMKGFDVVAGAQTFLRFLSDLRVTTFLTVEAPLEDVETPERMLARGEIRLFRWEREDLTVRAVGVEKFRGSSHDLRLHPYRIGPTGLDVNLTVTISRDTRQILEPPSAHPTVLLPAPAQEEGPFTIELLTYEVRDLLLVGADLTPIRRHIELALASARAGESVEAAEHLAKALGAGASLPGNMDPADPALSDEVRSALRRMTERAESSRGGWPPVRIPEPPILAAKLAKILADTTAAADASLVPRKEVVLPTPPTIPAPVAPAARTPSRERPVPPGRIPAPPVAVSKTLLPPPPAPKVVVPAAPLSTPPTSPAHPATAAPPARPGPPPLPKAVRMPDTVRATAPRPSSSLPPAAPPSRPAAPPPTPPGSRAAAPPPTA